MVSRTVHPTWADTRPSWTLVLPLKGGPAAKSRLGGGAQLARAIAADCLDAVLACPDVARVLVVTPDAPTADAAAAAGAVAVLETRPGGGLLAAVQDGLSAVAEEAAEEAADDPGADRIDPGPVGVLLGDLPALRPHDLSRGLGAVWAALGSGSQPPMAAVPDADGSGTVLLGARRAGDLSPAFGAGSMAEHVRRGAVPVVVDLPRLRRDVDTPDDLAAARELGVGRRTATLLARSRPAPYAEPVQATVHHFEPGTRSGTVVTDEGVLLPFDEQAFDSSPLLNLRPGQRLTITVTGEGAAMRVTGLALGSVGVVPPSPSRP